MTDKEIVDELIKYKISKITNYLYPLDVQDIIKALMKAIQEGREIGKHDALIEMGKQTKDQLQRGMELGKELERKEMQQEYFNQLMEHTIKAKAEGRRELAEERIKDIDNLLWLSTRWSSRKEDYTKHNCNGQDGNDISFTKKDFEKIKEDLIKIKIELQKEVKRNAKTNTQQHHN